MYIHKLFLLVWKLGWAYGPVKDTENANSKKEKEKEKEKEKGNRREDLNS